MSSTLSISNNEVKECLIVCQASDGVDIHAPLVKMTRLHVVFEIYGANTALRVSEVLGNFKIMVGERVLYSGRATVDNLVNTGQLVICEATLHEDSWLDLEFTPAMARAGHLREQFREFLQSWQKFYRIDPEFKAVMMDLQSFLTDLRLWLDQLELGLGALSIGERLSAERTVLTELEFSTTPAMGRLFEKFEEIARRVPREMQPAHQAFCRRQLHPLLMCAPFAHRTFNKPLGYAGDYEMVSMILRDRHEGGTLFARLFNGFILNQAMAVAHRNRVNYLTQKLLEETNRAVQLGGTARVFNIGCGPAQEMRNFLTEQPMSNHASLTLLDFNDETITNTSQALRELKLKHGRRTTIKQLKKSVQQLLKQASRSSAEGGEFDFVYCAGLFDYLPDPVCQRLMNHFYDLLAPGGLLVATNVTDAFQSVRPFRYSMEYILDWHLIYRSGPDLTSLAPEQAPPGSSTVVTEDIGVNVFLEVRKPRHA